MKKKRIDNQSVPILKLADFARRFRSYKPANRQRQLVKRRFRSYKPVNRQRLLQFVTDEQMGLFFQIAQEYRRNKSNLPAVDENEQALLDEAKSSTALMSGVENRLAETQRFIAGFAKPEQVATSALAEYAQSQIASVQQQCEEKFAFEYRRIEARKTRLSTRYAQRAELEFTIDLMDFVKGSYPQLKPSDQRSLIVAAMAGAACFTDAQLRGGTEPGSISMKLSRAKKYQRETYPEGRVYLFRTAEKEKIGSDSSEDPPSS